MAQLDFFSRRQRVVETKFRRDEAIPEPGLAITPAQIDQLARKGVAVSSYNYGMQFQGIESHTDGVPPEFRRGFDKIDAWNLQQSARKKVNNSRIKDEKMYG